MATQTITDKMDLMRPAPVVTGVESAVITEHQSNPLTEGMPVIVPIEGTDHLVDLDKSLLRVVGKIVNLDGSDTDYNDAVVASQNFLHTLWKNMKVSLNQTLITDNPDKMFPYLAFIDHLLEFSQKQEKSILQNELWMRDTPGFLEDFALISEDPNAIKNKGMFQRFSMTRGSNVFEMTGPLVLPLRKARKLLYNFIDILIRLEPNDNELILMHDLKLEDKKTFRKFKMQITLVEFKAYRLKLKDKLMAAYQLAAQKDGIMYTYIKPEVKRFPVLKNELNIIRENIFNNRVPFAYCLFFVEQECFQGKWNRNMFLLNHQDVEDIIPSINGHITKPMRGLNIEKNSSQEAFRNFCEFTETISGKNTYGDITIFDLRMGYCIFGCKLQNIDSDMTAKGVIPRFTDGSFKLELRFRNNDNRKNFEMIVIGYFNETLKIDASRNVIIN